MQLRSMQQWANISESSIDSMPKDCVMYHISVSDISTEYYCVCEKSNTAT